MITEAIRQSLSSLKRKSDGEFETVVIDIFTRKETSPSNASVKVRQGFLYPKPGDLIQVARYAFGGCGSVYTPTRVIRDPINGFPKVYIDLQDWKIPQVRAMGERYSNFASEIVAGEKYDTEEKLEKKLRREGMDYEVVLVDPDLSVLARKFMSSIGEHRPFGLYNYQIGMSPFPENLEADHLFGEINGIKRDGLLVEAVLHPLVGLPRVLVKEGKGRTILG